MHPDLLLGHMELYFTCLFLVTYKLPEMLDLMDLIQKTVSNSWFTIKRCYENVLYINQHLIDYKPVLEDLMSVKLLGPFSALEETYGSFDFPCDVSNSCFKFFEQSISSKMRSRQERKI